MYIAVANAIATASQQARKPESRATSLPSIPEEPEENRSASSSSGIAEFYVTYAIHSEAGMRSGREGGFTAPLQDLSGQS